MAISFNHTATQARLNEAKILAQFKKIVQSGIFLEGPQNQALIKALQHFWDTPYVVPVASGHDALRLTLSLLKLTPDQEIIVQANAYPTAFAAYQTSAKVVLSDVDINGQLTLSELQKNITPRTKVVIITHLYGFAGELSQITRYLKKRQITLIEDCAQAFGTTVAGRHVGTYGRFGCFSFYPTKNLGTFGDGGAIIAQNKNAYQTLLQAKSYGEKTKYHSLFVSDHSRLPELQASVLVLYLQQFRELQQKRQKMAKYFYQEMTRQHLDLFLRPLKSNSDVVPTVHLFVVRAKWRDSLQKYLRTKGIETHIHYPVPVHQVPAFQEKNAQTRSLPQVEHLSQEILSLPFHQFLQLKDVDHIVKLLKEFYLSQVAHLNSISFLFPTYNDGQSIPDLIEKADHLGQIIAQKYEIVVVDDGSQDDTWQVLTKLKKKYRHLNIVRHPQNQGYGGALQTGFGTVKSEWLFYTDSDGQYDPNEILFLLHELHLHPQLDVVNGYKKQRYDSVTRKLLGYVYNQLAHLVYPIPIRDVDCDFRLIKSTRLHALKLQSTSGLICLELVSQLARNGASFREVEVNHFARQFGHSQFFRPKHLWQTLLEQMSYFFRFYATK